MIAERSPPVQASARNPARRLHFTEREVAMRHNGSMLGLWIVRTRDTAAALLARVQTDLFVLTFSSAVRANACADALGAEGAPFYVCSANLAKIVREAGEAGARGFIVDYDAALGRFASAHPLPVPVQSAHALP